jgi:hypothetical protein
VGCYIIGEKGYEIYGVLVQGCVDATVTFDCEFK